MRARYIVILLDYTVKHIDKQEDAMIFETSQRGGRQKRVTVFSQQANRQAKLRLFRGLERFVNTGDSGEEYAALGKAWPSFWPIDTQAPIELANAPPKDIELIRWHPAAHDVFLVYRNYLRKIWVHDQESLDSGHLDILLGLNCRFADFRERESWSFQTKALNEAWESLRKVFPMIGIAGRPLVAPIWGAGIFSYTAINDFQQAVYQLFQESWRAKVCAACSSYLIAEKPAQIYCSSGCSNSSHRAASLKWWREKGAAKRADRASDRQHRHRRGRES